MFTHALMTWGDKMTKAEIDDIFGEFEIDEDYMIKSKDVIGLFVAVKEEPKKEEEAPAPVEEAPADEDEGDAKKKKKKKKKAAKQTLLLTQSCQNSQCLTDRRRLARDTCLGRTRIQYSTFHKLSVLYCIIVFS